MRIDIRGLQYVTALGRYRSFGQAAKALGVTQPTLSKVIRLLERSLGVSLFDRSRLGVSPTIYGEAILAGAAPTLRGVDDMLAEIHRLQTLEAGFVRVGAGPFALELSVAPVVLAMATQHPSIHLQVAQGRWGALTRDVLDGALDVAVAEVAGAAQQPGLTVEPIGSHGGAFYCRAGHPILELPTVSFPDIASYPLACNPLPERVAPYFKRASAAGRVDPVSGLFMPTLTFDSVALMKRAVLETDAVSWAPDVLIAEAVRQGSLVPLPFRADWARLNYGIIRRADKPVTPALEAFLTELRTAEKRLSISPAPKRVRRKQS